MMDPNDFQGGPTGPQFRQQQNADGNLAPPQATQGQRQDISGQYGFATTNANHNPFFFRFQSSLDGKVYEGQFTSKKLSIRDITMLGVRKVQLNGGFHYDENRPGQGIEEHIDQLNAMIAHLEIALIQWPAWFNLDLIYDPELLTRLYAKIMEFENSFFRSRDEAGPRQSVPTGGSPASEQSGSGGSTTPLGRGEVQPSLDP